MKKELVIIGEDDYEYTIDELETIVIKNKLGAVFEFKPDEIKFIKIVEVREENQ